MECSRAHVAIVLELAFFWDHQTLQHIKKACIVMYNMIVEDERNERLPLNYDAREGEGDDLAVSHDHTP